MLLTAVREVLARNEANTYSFTTSRVVSHYQSAKITGPIDGAKRESRGVKDRGGVRSIASASGRVLDARTMNTRTQARRQGARQDEKLAL